VAGGAAAAVRAGPARPAHRRLLLWDLKARGRVAKGRAGPIALDRPGLAVPVDSVDRAAPAGGDPAAAGAGRSSTRWSA
jgi:hypothetical protein